MKTSMKKNMLFFLLLAPLVIFTQCSTPEWQKKNNELIKQYSLTERELKVPNTKVESNLEPGKVTALDSVATAELYPGVDAQIYWGTGAMTAVLQLEANAQIPEEELPTDRFLFVLEGDVSQVADGTESKMIALKREEQDGTHSQTPRVDFIYLEKGTKSSLRAGINGAKVVEVYSPVRLDYMSKAGITDIPSSNVDVTSPATPNVEPNKVYDLYNLQLTELVPGANSRLITGKNVQVSFISMDPGAVFDRHIHPEEQTMLVLRGSCSELLLDSEQTMEKRKCSPHSPQHGSRSNNERPWL